MSLAARYLEERGIASVVVGCAKDIVEHCGVPRFLFVDFPLGNPAGRPFDPESQSAVVAQALALLDSAAAPRTTERAALEWNGDADWRTVYNRVDDGNREALRRLGEERRARQARERPSAVR